MGALAGLDLSRSRFRPPQGAKALPPALEVDHSAKAKLKALCDQALEKRAPQTYAEIRRICALPVVHPLTPEEAVAISRNEVLAEAYAEGFRLREQQAAALLAYDHYTGPFCPISVGGGKCVAGSTEIVDAHAGRLTVREAVSKPALRVFALDEHGKLGLHNAHAFESGQKPCVKLTLASGQSVELSTDHPVLTGRGWVPAAEVTTDDLVAVPRALPMNTEETISDDEVIFVAYMLSDGGTSQDHFSFTNETPEIVSEMREVVERLGGYLSVKKEPDDKSACFEFGVRSVRRFVDKWQIRGTSHEKRVPAQFYLLSDRQIALFLNRFWACDGHVSENKCEVSLVSEEMIDDLRVMLLRLGIVARKRSKPTTWTHKGVRKHSTAWRLTVSHRESLERFVRLVGLPLGKHGAFDRLLVSMARPHNTNTDVIPFGAKEFQDLCAEVGLQGRGGVRTPGRPRTEIRKALGLTAGQKVGRDTFRAWVESSGYSGGYALLAYSDVAWEYPKSIESTGVQPVYDLSVPGAGNFVANGICVHNTLVSIMLAERGHRQGIERSVLLVPPAVYGQLVGSDIAWARKKVPLTVPFHFMQRGQKQRLALAASGWRGCYILPYSLLSTKDTSQVLAQIAPGLIIADEAHNLRHRGAARTRRVMDFIDEHEPKLVLMSGTITGKGIRDYWHLIRASLRDNCPLPLSSQLADDWGDVLDAKDQAPSKSAGRVLVPLIDWARENFPDEDESLEETVGGFRAAYRLRLTSAPGVVTTTETALGTTLILHNEPVAFKETDPGPAEMLRLMRDVDGGVTPNGDEIEYAIHAYKWRYELSSGFYNRLYWPEPDPARGRTAEVIERSQMYHARLNAYHGTPEIGLRDWLKENARDGLDTPMLVGANMARYGARDVGSDLYRLWREMKDADFEGRIERDAEAVRVCDYKVKRVVQWAQSLPKGAGGIVWHWHKAIGRWIYEELLAAGVDTVHCPAGENARVLDPANASKILVCSIWAHGTGKNLQHFQHQIAPQWPRGAIQAEQMLGRTHRPGQTADELIFERCDTLPFDFQNFAACLNDAIYIHQSTGNEQKLVYGVYDPLPKVYPDEWLRERGFRAKRLNAAQRALLAERFGDQGGAGFDD